VVLVAAAGWWAVRVIARAGAPRIRSLAVLPLQNLSGDTAQNYFVLGMYDQLIGELEQVTALRVISRTSAQAAYDAHKSVPEIARALNVDAVVEGSVLQTGDSVQLRVQLVRARPAEQKVWGQSYVRNTRDVLGLNSDVARTVASQVKASLTSGEAARLGHARRVNPRTYEAYLRGMYVLDKALPAEYPRAIAYLRAAVDSDPSDPSAYAGLALGYITTAHGPTPDLDALPLARQAAERALQLDSTLAETMAALGFLKGYCDWDWDASDSLFRRALALNPSLMEAHYWYAWQLALFGHMDSAIAEHKRAEEEDPLNPQTSSWLGDFYVWVGRYDDAMAEARRAISVAPRDPIGHLVEAEVYLARGRNDDAVAAARTAVEADSEWLFVLGYALAFAGRQGEARKIASELERLPVTPWHAYCLAAVYASLGDKDKAFRWLNYEHPHAGLPWAKREVWFAKIWGDPRFARLLQKWHVPPRS
jgi:TolB-like protein